MRCPGCHTNFNNERQLTTVNPPEQEDVAWYKLAPAGKVVCPQCGTPLRHRRVTMVTATAIGLIFLAAMSLKTLYPESVAVEVLVWLSGIAVAVGMPMLMRSRGYFRRGEQ